MFGMFSFIFCSGMDVLEANILEAEKDLAELEALVEAYKPGAPSGDVLKRGRALMQRFEELAAESLERCCRHEEGALDAFHYVLALIDRLSPSMVYCCSLKPALVQAAGGTGNIAANKGSGTLPPNVNEKLASSADGANAFALDVKELERIVGHLQAAETVGSGIAWAVGFIGKMLNLALEPASVQEWPSVVGGPQRKTAAAHPVGSCEQAVPAHARPEARSLRPPQRNFGAPPPSVGGLRKLGAPPPSAGGLKPARKREVTFAPCRQQQRSTCDLRAYRLEELKQVEIDVASMRPRRRNVDEPLGATEQPQQGEGLWASLRQRRKSVGDAADKAKPLGFLADWRKILGEVSGATVEHERLAEAPDAPARPRRRSWGYSSDSGLGIRDFCASKVYTAVTQGVA